MKKIIETISLLITLITAAVLFSACGFLGSKEETISPVEETPSPKYKWSAKETTLESIAYELIPLCYEFDGYWAYRYEKVGEEIPQEIQEAALNNEEEVYNDGRYDVFQEKLYYVSYNGEIISLDNYEQIEKETNTNNWKDFTSLCVLDGVAVDSKELYTLEHSIISGNTKPDKKEDIDDEVDYNQFEVNYYICSHDKENGKSLSSSIVDCDEDISFNPKGMHLVDDNICIITVKDGSNGISIISKEGKVLKSFFFGGEIKSLIKLNDGSSAIAAINENELGIYEVDFDNSKFNLMATLDKRDVSVFSGNNEYEFIYGDNLNLYGWNEGENFLLSWSGINVNGSKIATDIVARTDGTLVFEIKDNVNGSYSAKLLTLTSTLYSRAKERDILYLATNSVDSNLQDLIAKYNSENPKHKIEITDDFARADILNLKDLNYPLMAANGELVDLYPYMDKDDEINRTDFLSNVLSALEYDGKMCTSVAGFSIDTVIGPESLVGEKCGWTYDQYYNVLNSNDIDAFDLYTTKGDMFKESLIIDINSFIDWEDKSCNFNNEGFIKLLEFANSFPENTRIENNAFNDDSGSSTDLRIFHGKQMLLRTTLFDFNDLQKSGFEFNEQITYIGYPTANGVGNLITITSTEDGSNFGISSSSTHKDEAWNFIRMFFLEEYQQNFYCFPINISAFNKQFDAAKQFEYLYDEDGYIMTDEESGKQLLKPAGTMYLSDYTAISYYPLSETKANKVVDLVTSTTKIYDFDQSIYDIIEENTKEYFKGEINSFQAAEQVQKAMTEYIGRWK